MGGRDSPPPPWTRPIRTRTSSRGSGLARGSRPTSRPGSSAGPTSATPPWPRCSGTTPSLPAPPRPATSPPARPRRSCSVTSPWRVAGPPAVVAATAREVDVVAGPHPLRERRRGALGLLPSSPTLPVRSTSSAVLTPSGRGAVACAAIVVAGPPAVVAAAALDAEVVDGPHHLREVVTRRWRPSSSQALLLVGDCRLLLVVESIVDPTYAACFLIPACFRRSSPRPIMRSVLSPRRSGITPRTERQRRSRRSSLVTRHSSSIR